jgi:hypothetical protein
VAYGYCYWKWLELALLIGYGPNKVVVGGKVWVSEATLISRKMPNQPIVTIRALPVVIDNFQIPPLPNSIQFKPAKNPLAQRMRYHD